MTKTFPKLYKKASTGKISEWEVFVEENNKGHGVINVVHGYIDGKHQHDKKTVDKGKNEGKANETTPLEIGRFSALPGCSLLKFKLKISGAYRVSKYLRRLKRFLIKA